MLAAEQKSFQLVIAATRQLGIGKAGTMPWKLPADMAYFKELTSTTHDPAKMNAVVSGHHPAGRRLDLFHDVSASMHADHSCALINCKTCALAGHLTAVPGCAAAAWPA